MINKNMYAMKNVLFLFLNLSIIIYNSLIQQWNLKPTGFYKCFSSIINIKPI